MLLLDTNVLLYATHPRFPAHASCLPWLNAALGGDETVGFAWIATIGFLRIATSPRVFELPLTIDEATEQIDRWLAAPAAVAVEPGPGHIGRVATLLTQAGRAGDLVPDAHLAALALEHDATVASFDRDFQQFEGVTSLVPS